MVQTMMHSVERMQADVTDRIFRDSRIDISDIDIAVSGGVVTLTGTVPSFSDRRYAGSDALLAAGVTSVNNRLKVRFPAGRAVPGDEEIRTRIRSLLDWSSNIDASRIDVAVRNGTVILEGTLDAYWKKLRAEDIAGDIYGVTDIVNRIAVAPSDSITDEGIADQVFAVLNRNISFDINEVAVKVFGGIVTLSGTVPDWASYRSADDIVANVQGVIAVQNHLSVREPAAEEAVKGRR